MAAKPVRIAYLADASDIVRASNEAAAAMDGAANQARSSGERIDAAFASTAGAADSAASASSQLAGGIGDLSGALESTGFISEGTAKSLAVAEAAIMGVTGASDLLNLATEKIPGLQKVATAATNGLAAAKRGLGVAIRFALGPVGLLIAGAALLTAGLVLAYNRSETFRNIVDKAFAAVGRAAGAMRELIGAALGKIADLISNFTGPGLLVKHWDKVKEAGSAAFNGIKDVARAAFNGIASLWNSTVGKLSFKVPGWVPGIGGNGWDVPDIPMLAAGGIVNSATLALIGEAGPEAVIPLDRLGEMGGGGLVRVELTAEQLSSLERGRRIALDLSSYRAAGGAA
jgi:phage-related protein